MEIFIMKYKLINNKFFFNGEEVDNRSILSVLNFKDGYEIEVMLQESGVRKQPSYTTGQTARVLKLAKSTIILYCDRFINKEEGYLEYYLVGKHRKIPHHALKTYIQRHY